MKKFTISILLLLLISTFFVGCSNLLDEKPISTLSKDQFWKSPDDAQAWMAGMYDGMQKALSFRYLEWGETRSDNLENAGTGLTQVKLLNNGITSDMSQCDWTDLYKVISRANFAIKYIPLTPNVDPSVLKKYLGQAYAMRAYMYFYAIRVWGRVPLITEPYEGGTQTQFYKRSPIDSLKTQIQADIDRSINLLNADPGVFYINKGGALAMKTDIHMWFKEYDKAISASDALIALNQYSLVTNSTDWKYIFTAPDGSKETIFNMYWSYLEEGTGSGAASMLASGSNSSNYKAQDSIWFSLVARGKKDARMWLCFDTVSMYNNGGKLPIGDLNYSDISKTGKFNEWDFGKQAFKYYNNSQSDIRIPLYRYADVMLLRAEALNQLNRKPEALAIVNSIRQRVGYLVTAESQLGANPTTYNVESLILAERKLEFFGEGKRWFDLIRTNRVIGVMDLVLKKRQAAGGLPLEGFGDPNKILFPLAAKVFEANPLLVGDQNPPYSE